MGILSYGYKAIKSVKPKPISKATKKFKRSIEQTKKAVKKGTDDFQKKNPKSLVTDKDIKKVQKDTAEKYNKKSRKEYLRERKVFGGRIKKKKPENTPQKQRRQEGQKRKPKIDLIIAIDDGKPKTRERKMGGGMMGRPMYKKGSKKAVGKSNFGMLSVKAGIDNNPKPTHADRIAGAKMKQKS